ncbi:hypothetical protein CH300_20005 [Rhodococcus sp. 15-1154-1]|nr:hypothetical protein [Rhodococcus sp. 15-1154-1]OZF00828.1 hypothetical protein CH300_20005 [Rhodococcus sp. 15-1154-1]
MFYDDVTAADEWWASRTDKRRIQIWRLCEKLAERGHPPVAGQLAIALPSTRRPVARPADAGRSADRWWHGTPPERRAQIRGWLADEDLSVHIECEGQLAMPVPRQRHTAERA